MSSEKQATSDKAVSEQHESVKDVGDAGLKDVKIEQSHEVDYTGATKKTNPKEVALVKKLDYRIMPILWAMYFMNYVRDSGVSLVPSTRVLTALHSWIVMPSPMPVSIT